MMTAVAIGAMSPKLLHPAASPQLPEPPLRLKPSEIKIYMGAETLIDWTPTQIHNCPFLRELQPPGSPDQLPGLLDRIGQTVTLLIHDFPQIACDETIFSEASLGMRSSRIFYQGFHVRNRHQYSNFKLFRVESTIKPVE